MMTQHDFFRKAPYMWVGFLSLGTFALSLAFPAYYQGDHFFLGRDILLIGWLGALEANFAWFANPIYLLALGLAQWRCRDFMILAWIAVCVAASFLLCKAVTLKPHLGAMPITSLGWGFYLWLLAMVLAAFSLSHFFYVLKTNS
ncbi:hypothetical protein M2401_000757 [Pseudomonas sp. JUb42]|jgi:hypothetical protein|uniref:hypothetical protein n=1 Tax=Pseudomonas sp. JUb42 TaxID=2940611 RepID=UPI002167DA03|nr:hypothetical protein [Pseudomonas sp. JUb42]MCS3467036.1 hypothetical protein [Pseudomonas sp. JUb42]